MDKKVTVLAPNGRRVVVKINQNTTLLQILEEVCQKQGLDSDDYLLTHHNKEVGLTQIFRFSGLPNNCLLEMEKLEKKRTASNVEICVQLENGTRAQGQFKPSDNLWHVADVLSDKIVEKYESPVAIYMRQEIVGKEGMSQTSLKSLGITAGRAMIRIINKNPEELKTQANVYIPPKPKETSNDDNDSTPGTSKSFAGSAGSAGRGGAGGFAITKDLVQSLKANAANVKSTTVATAAEETGNENVTPKPSEEPKYDWGSGVGRTMRDSSMDVTETTGNSDEQNDGSLEPEPEIHIIGERDAIIYSLDGTKKQNEEDLPDSFFDLTVEDLKLVLRDLKNIASGNENAPLLTQKLRELEENKTMLKKIGQYKSCIIRIQFPDRHVLQATFKPIETIADVVEFIRKFLQRSNARFHLFTIPPKKILPLEKTLLELDFVPTSVVHFVFEDEDGNSIASDMEQIYIREEFLEKLTTVEGALFAARKLR